MLSKIIKILVLILCSTEIICMIEKSGLRNRKIKMISKEDEVIYKFKKTISERLDELFEDVEFFVQKGKFVKAKKWLKSYCEQLIKYFDPKEEIQNIKELVLAFKLRSQLLIEQFESNLPLVKLQGNETLKIVEFFTALCVGLFGLCAFDSGIILLALIIFFAAYCDPMISFSVGSLITFIHIDNDPEMLKKFIYIISSVFIVCFKKIVDKRIEKNIALKEIKKVIADFEKNLIIQINS